MLNLAVALTDAAHRSPGRDAVVLGDTRLTYAQVDGAASQVAGALVELGVQPGDRVALSCPNLPYFPIAYYGILKAGGAVVPLNVLFKSREVAYHLGDSGARVHLCFEGTSELPMAAEGHAGFERSDTCQHFVVITADPEAPSPIAGAPTLGALMAGRSPRFDTVQRRADDTAVILYTSGTTGTPKGAELSHSNMVMNAKASADLFGFAGGDVLLVVLPLFHSFGQTVLQNGGFLAGATLVLQPRFDAAAALSLMARHRVTMFAGVPTMYWAMLAALDDHTDVEPIAAPLKVAVSGGASLPLQVLRDFEAKLGVPILEGYGLSETSPVASFNHRDRERKPGSIGQPIWGVEMQIVDEDGRPLPPGETGEVVIRGHNVMKGYYERPQDTAEAFRTGWFHSGDVGRTDEDGYFYIVDRTKDMILRGGFNVYPREVEEVMMEHDDVSLVAVVGVPDQALGEEVKAFVVPSPGSTIVGEELILWCKERMAAYKYPRVVELRESLPMTATGKILKKELRTGA